MKPTQAILMALLLAGTYSGQEVMGQEQEERKGLTSNLEVLFSALPPVAPNDYEKLDQWIDSSYYNPTYVFVRYTKPVKVDTGGDQGIIELASIIEVSIGDHAGFTTQLAPCIRKTYDYEKMVKVKGMYEGRESVFSGNNICIGSEKIFIVRKRYLVTLNASYMCDLTVLDQIIDSMDLDRLL